MPPPEPSADACIFNTCLHLARSSHHLWTGTPICADSPWAKVPSSLAPCNPVGLELHTLQSLNPLSTAEYLCQHWPSFEIVRKSKFFVNYTIGSRTRWHQIREATTSSLYSSEIRLVLGTIAISLSIAAMAGHFALVGGRVFTGTPVESSAGAAFSMSTTAISTRTVIPNSTMTAKYPKTLALLPQGHG